VIAGTRELGEFVELFQPHAVAELEVGVQFWREDAALTLPVGSQQRLWVVGAAERPRPVDNGQNGICGLELDGPHSGLIRDPGGLRDPIQPLHQVGSADDVGQLREIVVGERGEFPGG
jgi:hypothetical protein